MKAAGVCETFQIGVAVHSSGELGIQLATMLHLGAVIPNLSFAADAHYHHLTDDIIEGGLMQYEDGAIARADGPGLGVKLDREKLRRVQRAVSAAGGYPYDQDPGRPGWTPIIPNDRWADPKDDRTVVCAGSPCFLTLSFHAESGHDAGSDMRRSRLRRACRRLVSIAGHSQVLRTAQQELIAGIRG